MSKVSPLYAPEPSVGEGVEVAHLYVEQIALINKSLAHDN